MPSISVIGVSIAIIYFLILHRFLFKKPLYRFIIISWPVLGMIPGLLFVLHRVFDFAVEVLENSGLTFPFKGPWFAGMDMLVTVDPANIHYLLNSSFSNFARGSDFREVFDAFEDSLLTKDSDAWKNLRKASQVMINHQGYQRLSISTTRSKLKDGLVPFFNHIAEEGTTVDLQDVFWRFAYDTTIVTVTGCDDPRSLSIEMPEIESATALNNIGEGVIYRHAKPRFLWKLQNWIGVGIEKKMTEAGVVFDRVCAEYISTNREEIKRSQGINHDHLDGESEDLLTSHMKLDPTKYQLMNPINDKFLRDTIVGFLLAGRDTIASALTWFFWILSENPRVVTKIRQEIDDTILPRGSSGQERPSYDPIEYLDKLVYLHAALCETMRLNPPVPIERMSPVKSDVLPSGHKVEANSKILIFIYALGKMRAIWGEDALEFKPERWISKTGALRHIPSFKFLAFNGGPRSCLGKHIAMIQMKIVVVEILQNYDINVANGQKIQPENHMILRMKQGLKVTINKRC
ncbi:PREDICTED: alkane hydroxylase MAH1-like [Camelina sativa]|uniref:Alkane hydroxylase MAH1-like n=1 Tax=Camelina sativa TaxID=90675 RepID=A0ABM0UL48_CAMSA|nr:PREDICTED: alkane hydroxylase MAH1-like [Camelina sativa]